MATHSEIAQKMGRELASLQKKMEAETDRRLQTSYAKQIEDIKSFLKNDLPADQKDAAARERDSRIQEAKSHVDLNDIDVEFNLPEGEAMARKEGTYREPAQDDEMIEVGADNEQEEGEEGQFGYKGKMNSKKKPYKYIDPTDVKSQPDYLGGAYLENDINRRARLNAALIGAGTGAGLGTMMGMAGNNGKFSQYGETIPLIIPGAGALLGGGLSYGMADSNLDWERENERMRQEYMQGYDTPSNPANMYAYGGRLPQHGIGTSDPDSVAYSWEQVGQPLGDSAPKQGMNWGSMFSGMGKGLGQGARTNAQNQQMQAPMMFNEAMLNSPSSYIFNPFYNAEANNMYSVLNQQDQGQQQLANLAKANIYYSPRAALDNLDNTYADMAKMDYYGDPNAGLSAQMKLIGDKADKRGDVLQKYAEANAEANSPDAKMKRIGESMIPLQGMFTNLHNLGAERTQADQAAFDWNNKMDAARGNIARQNAVDWSNYGQGQRRDDMMQSAYNTGNGFTRMNPYTGQVEWVSNQAPGQ